MDSQAIMILVNTFIQTAYNLLASAQQVYGEDKIPTWEQVVSNNAMLQAKIDAQK